MNRAEALARSLAAGEIIQPRHGPKTMRGSGPAHTTPYSPQGDAARTGRHKHKARRSRRGA